MPAAPSTDWQEEIAPDEGERFERHAELLRDIQRAQSRKKGPGRALHRKQHVGAEADFEALGGLEPEVAAGLFARPGRYSAYVRFSNGRQVHAPDIAPDLRGLAVKVVGVGGRKIIPGLEDAPTQDFLCINADSQPFPNTDEFMKFVRAVNNQALALPRLMRTFGPIRAAKLLLHLRTLGAPGSLATVPYYSAAPVRWGDYAAKYAFFPAAEADRRRNGRGADRLGHDLAARLGEGPLAFDMKVQLFRDARSTPIEDASVAWTEQAAPWSTIGRLTIPQQDVLGERGARTSELVEGLSFDPWHALEAHRPLGDIMRARNHAYRLSTQDRQAAPEPDGSEAL